MATKIQITHAKPMLTLSFYTEYQKKVLNEYKYENAIIPITGFYECSNVSTFLRFEDFSFNPEKNPQKTGKLFMINGLLAHYSTPDGFDSVQNKEQIFKCIKEKKPHFILFIYGDLKTFIFRSKFTFLHTDIVEYKIKKLFPKIEEENIKKEIEEHISGNSTKVTEDGWYSPENSNYILINDISSELKTIPAFIKNAVYDLYPKNNKINYVILNKSNDAFLTITLDSIQIKEEVLSDFSNIVVTKADLKTMFNAETIAENAVDLNINLMKWRMSPFLDTDIIKKSKYLLIGAGTLGCHVSRCLLGWGAIHITFIDNGKVSYSNPVRQSLYTFEDSTKVDSNYKALLAAQKLKEIFPKSDSKGFNIQIPLPGRTLIGDTAKESYLKDLNILEDQIKSHDIIFLLTDSRESRWYPTVIAKAYNKKVITAAIGFDSYLVMRHGTKEDGLGCYFCTDIVSPTDTSGGRTLDQQCTISRPGVSMISSGLAIELAMSVMNATLNENDTIQTVPHQIRGCLLNYSTQILRHECNKNCVACSDRVVNEYLNNREKFLIDIMNDPYYIEKISGVADLIKDIKLDCGGDDDDF